MSIAIVKKSPGVTHRAIALLDVPYGKCFLIIFIVHYFLWLKNNGSCLISGST